MLIFKVCTLAVRCNRCEYTTNISNVQTFTRNKYKKHENTLKNPTFCGRNVVNRAIL